MQVRCGRLGFLINQVWLWNVALKDYGVDYEISLGRDKPWHRLAISQADAREVLEKNRPPGKFLPWLRDREELARDAAAFCDQALP